MKPRALAWIVVLGALIGFLCCDREALSLGLSWLFPDVQTTIYPRAEPYFLVGEHLLLVGTSSLLAATTGILLGIALTRKSGKALLPLGERLAALAQTIPPAAILALTVPLLGFGFAPTITALFLYGTLPVLRGALTGFQSVPFSVVEAARGMGMKESQVLWRVELPLSRPYLVAGLRISVVVNVGTTAIGATIGAGGLGAPIVSGLVNQNPSFVLEGALLSGLLALFLDAIFGLFSSRLPTATQR